MVILNLNTKIILKNVCFTYNMKGESSIFHYQQIFASIFRTGIL